MEWLPTIGFGLLGLAAIAVLLAIVVFAIGLKW